MAHSAVGSIVIVAATGATALALIAAAIAISGGDAPAGGRVALRVGAGLVLLALVLAVARRRWFVLGPSVTVGAVVALAVAAALAGDELLSSLLVGPLIVGVAVRTGGGTGVGLERVPRRRGAARRPAGLPRARGAAHRPARAGLRRRSPRCWRLLAAVIAIKAGAGYAAARMAGFDAADARAIGALMQCGGRHDDRDLARPARGPRDRRAHARDAHPDRPRDDHRRRPAAAPHRGGARRSLRPWPRPPARTGSDRSRPRRCATMAPSPSSFEPSRSDRSPGRELLAELIAYFNEIYPGRAARPGSVTTPDEMVAAARRVPRRLRGRRAHRDRRPATARGARGLRDQADVRRAGRALARGRTGAAGRARGCGARASAIERVRLDAGPEQRHSRALFASAGYVEIERYNDNHIADYFAEKRLRVV